MDSTSGFEKSGHHHQAEQAKKSRQDSNEFHFSRKEQESGQEARIENRNE